VIYSYRFTAFALLFLGGSGCAARPRVAPLHVARASAGIYEALLAHAFPAGRPDTILLDDKTVSYHDLPAGNWLRRGKDVVPSPLPARLSALSAAALAVPPQVFAAPVRLLSTASALRLAERRLGGTTILAVTPIAFTDDSSQALVYYDARCGGLCGGGYELWFVRAADGRWVLRQDLAHWIG
jgi:hypothetical protein